MGAKILKRQWRYFTYVVEQPIDWIVFPGKFPKISNNELLIEVLSKLPESSSGLVGWMGWAAWLIFWTFCLTYIFAQKMRWKQSTSERRWKNRLSIIHLNSLDTYLKSLSLWSNYFYSSPVAGVSASNNNETMTMIREKRESRHSAKESSRMHKSEQKRCFSNSKDFLLWLLFAKEKYIIQWLWKFCATAEKDLLLFAKFQQ